MEIKLIVSRQNLYKEALKKVEECCSLSAVVLSLLSGINYTNPWDDHSCTPPKFFALGEFFPAWGYEVRTLLHRISINNNYAWIVINGHYSPHENKESFDSDNYISNLCGTSPEGMLEASNMFRKCSLTGVYRPLPGKEFRMVYDFFWVTNSGYTVSVESIDFERVEVSIYAPGSENFSLVMKDRLKNFS